jgi:hypothetical protein
MEKYRQDHLERIIESHDEEAKTIMLKSSVIAYNNLPE